MAHAPSFAGDPVRVTIIDAAAKLLAESPSASMEEIAGAAGVSRATVYRRFPSRGDLVGALIDAAVGEAEDRLTEAALDTAAVEEAIARAVRSLVTVGDRYVVLVREYVTPEAAANERRVAAPLVAVLERGRSDGTIRTDVPVAWLIEALLALVATGVRTRAAFGLGSEDTATLICRLFLEGACTPR